MSDPHCGWLAELSRLQPQLHFIQLQHQLELLLLCSDMSIFVRISSNFLHAILRPQATIWTKNPLNPAKIGAKTTPLFYKRRNKIVKPRSMI